MIRDIFLFLIRCYQRLISPALGHNCRFYPSCSQYAYEAFQRYPIIRALRLTVCRLLKCHPFNPGGLDPLK